MEAGSGNGGGADLMERQDEGYGGRRINVVLEFDGVFTVSDKFKDVSAVRQIEIDMGEGLKMPVLINETMIETFLKPLAAMKYFRLHWLSPWASQLNTMFLETEGIQPFETVTVHDPVLHEEYLAAAKLMGETPTDSLPDVYRAFEFDNDPLGWVGTNMQADAHRWANFVRPNTMVHSVESTETGISGHEAAMVMHMLTNFLS